ncbi:hypothetical protein BDZ89DRAFT_45122 [Hymenopellis radicata]|nr:hypothetical protein BDZ89DRAFT_45122 [Hymenopellis radicata]
MSHYQSSSSSDDSDEPASSTPTPHSRLRRSDSHVSRRSAMEAPFHHHQGTSHSQPSPSPSTRRPPPLVRALSAHSARRATRSASLSSAYRGFRDDEIFSEDDEDEGPAERAERRRRNGKSAVVDDVAEEGDDEQANTSDVEEITLKERQALINVEHPFGLPIWKPALYKKSRSVTRYADEALHSVPSAQAERHLLPGNIFWAVAFGWWLALACFAVSAILRVIPNGGDRYSSLIFGLGWYLVWPFGKYVEGEQDDLHKRQMSDDSGITVRGVDDASRTIRGPGHSTIPAHHVQTLSWEPVIIPGEHTSLLQAVEEVHSPPLLPSLTVRHSLRPPPRIVRLRSTKWTRLLS